MSPQQSKITPLGIIENHALDVFAHNVIDHEPLVVSDKCLIEIVLRSDETETYLTLDGQIGHPLRTGDRVQVRRDRSYVLMVRSRRKSYFEVLRHKLRWGER